MSKLLDSMRSLVDNNSSFSSKSFALLISTITGGLIVLCICYVLIYDVMTNGFIKTDLADLGVFLLFVGMYIAGSGIPKTIAGRFDKFHPTSIQEDDNKDESSDSESKEG